MSTLQKNQTRICSSGQGSQHWEKGDQLYIHVDTVFSLPTRFVWKLIETFLLISIRLVKRFLMNFTFRTQLWNNLVRAKSELTFTRAQIPKPWIENIKTVCALSLISLFYAKRNFVVRLFATFCLYLFYCDVVRI